MYRLSPPFRPTNRASGSYQALRIIPTLTCWNHRSRSSSRRYESAAISGLYHSRSIGSGSVFVVAEAGRIPEEQRILHHFGIVVAVVERTLRTGDVNRKIGRYRHAFRIGQAVVGAQRGKQRGGEIHKIFVVVFPIATAFLPASVRREGRQHVEYDGSGLFRIASTYTRTTASARTGTS